MPPNLRETFAALQGSREGRKLFNRIQMADPYPDKRFTPVIASWVLNHKVAPEEHAQDIVEFKALRGRLKDLRVPATNKKRTATVKALLSKRPEDFAGHYSELQAWNREVSDLLDPKTDLSDEGLPVEMRYNGYTMYRISMKKHCRVPLVTNAMSWCVTKGAFGQYGGPPYYPIIRDHDRKPFCIVIPSYFDKDPDQAVRNANNNGKISDSDLAKIRPLLQHVLPIDQHTDPYINGIHRVRTGLPEKPGPHEAYTIFRDYAMMPGEWPEGEQAIARDPKAALKYATRIGGPWKPGEKAIGGHPQSAFRYALNVIEGPFPEGEKAISKDSTFAYHYAIDVLKGPFPAGEKAIAKHYTAAYNYARLILKGPFPAGEKAISKRDWYAYQYAKYVLNGPFPLGERTISKDARSAYEYAHEVLKAPWPKGERTICQSAEWAYNYATYVLKGRFLKGEKAINEHADYAHRYADDMALAENTADVRARPVKRRAAGK